MDTPRVVRAITRPDAAVVDRLAAHAAATIHEAQGRRGLLAPAIRPIQSRARIAGPAVTVLSHPGDNLMIHAAVEVVQTGDVLVVATTSRSTDGMFGELLATSLRAAGCRGAVLDAGVRDVTDLEDMGFPVWARAIHAQGTVKATPGSVNVPVVCASTAVRPGDVVVADDDGVVVVPASEAARVADAADERVQREARVRDRLEAGELGLDIYGLRERLRELGVVHVDDDAVPEGAPPDDG